VRSDNNYLVRASRQHANDVGQLRSLHGLLENVLSLATGFGEHLLKRRFTLLVIAGVFLQSSFNHLTRNQLEAYWVRDGYDAGE
jgi:hypothetical protein